MTASLLVGLPTVALLLPCYLASLAIGVPLLASSKIVGGKYGICRWRVQEQHTHTIQVIDG